MSADIDAMAQLNSKLASFSVHYTFTVQPLNVPGSINLPAAVSSISIADIHDMQFDQADQISLPDVALLAQKTLLNCADVTLSSTVVLTLTGQQSWSVSKTQGVSTSLGASIKGTIDVVDLGFTFSETISSSVTQQESEQNTITRQMSDTVNVGPQKAVKISIIAYQKSIQIPFTATIVVDGDIRALSNLDNMAQSVHKASELLSAADRTFTVQGGLTVSNVTDATVRTDDLDVETNCAGSNGSVINDLGQIAIAPTELASHL